MCYQPGGSGGSAISTGWQFKAGYQTSSDRARAGRWFETRERCWQALSSQQSSTATCRVLLREASPGEAAGTCAAADEQRPEDRKQSPVLNRTDTHRGHLSLLCGTGEVQLVGGRLLSTAGRDKCPILLSSNVASKLNSHAKWRRSSEKNASRPADASKRIASLRNRPARRPKTPARWPRITVSTL